MRFHPQRWLALSRIAFGGFVLLACLSPSWSEGAFSWLSLYRFDVGGKTFGVSMLFALPVLAWALWGVAWFSMPARPGWRWGRWQVAVPVFGFGLLALLRAWPVHQIYIAARSVVGVLLFWMVYSYTLQAGSKRWVVRLLAVIVLVQGAVAVAQFLAQRSLGLAWIGELPLAPEIHGVSVIEAGGRRWLRAYGLTPHPNVLGGYLGAAMLACLSVLPSASRRARWWLGFVILAGGLGLFCTFSRSAWFGTMGGLGYWVVVTRPWRWVQWSALPVRRTLGVVGIVVLAGLVALNVVYGDLIRSRLLLSGSELEVHSVNERVRDSRQALGLIRQVPFKGVGTGYYVAALWANAGDNRPPAFQHVHNVVLLAAAELGIAGALLWLWLVGGPLLEGLHNAHHRLRRLRSGAHNPAGWAAAFVLLFVVSFLDYYLYFPATWWSAFYIGMLAGVWARPPEGQDATT